MKLLTFDIETVPQRRWVDPRQLSQEDVEAEALDAFISEHLTLQSELLESDGPIGMGAVPLKATGTVPACHPTTCRVVGACWGWLSTDGSHLVKAQTLTDFKLTKRQKPIQRWREAELDEAEEALLERCLQALWKIQHDGGRLITFNGKGFDLPVIRWRAAQLGMDSIIINRGRQGDPNDSKLTSLEGLIPWKGLLYPYDHKQHTDLRLLFSDGSKFARGTLEWWAQAFGIKVKQEGHGSQVWEKLHNVRGWKWLHKYAEEEADVLLRMWKAVERYV